AVARAGFNGDEPTAAQRRAAIGRLAADAPERRIWDALDALDPEGAGFLDSARAAAADVRPLVGAMRDRTQLPAGIQPHTGADVTVVLANNETYVSRRVARVAPGVQLRVAVVNRDGFARSVEARELRDRRPVFGPIDWGEFDWGPLGSATPLAAGETELLTLTPATGAFAVWLGDPAGGDQAAAMVELDRGPRTQAFRFGPDFASPRHVAEDPQGRMWVTLEGIDTIARLTPAGELAQSSVERYPLPGGAHTLDSLQNPLAPADVFVDGNGIVWTTLFLGNAIARIDPELARDGTGQGITIHRLDPCPTSDPATACREEFPPSPGGPSRGPLQLEGTLDADGNTVLAFTEMNVDAIGLMRFSPDGRELNRADVPCDCVAPLGVALGRDGSIWFSEGDTNALGRMRLDQARPYSASTARIEHHPLPFGTTIEDPEHPEPIFSALPHSVAIDPLGRVWLTGEAVAKVAYLDPRAARPGTSDGIVSFDTGHTEFGGLTAPADLAIDRAGTVHWSDEYGDVIGRLDDGGTRAPLRPLARRSLTDSPVVDSRGDLWFMELGANLLTRVEGVTEGAPRPARQPLAVASTSDDVLTGERFSEATSVDVQVVRSGAVVARAAGVPVAGGAFAVGAGPAGSATARWSGPQAANPLAAGDTVRIAPRGTYEREPLTFGLAHLTAAVNTTGALAGRALADGRPLGGHVDATIGDRDLRTALNPVDGRFVQAPQPSLAPGAAGTLAWTAATVGLVARTVTRFPDVPEPPAPDQPLPPLPPQPRGDVPVTPVDPGATVPAPQRLPQQSPPAAQTPACADHWLTGRGRRARVELLGLPAADLARCLGAPDASASRRGVRRLRYHGKLSVEVRRGRVAGFDLAPPGLRSAAGNVGLGSPVGKLRKLLRGVPLRGRGDTRRAILRTASGGRAVLTVELSLRHPRRIVHVSVDRRKSR
ncbi:MAG TPA: hypothetical protein VHF88_01195, partial [Thermoleophilaceae bacterium]|nr:hypothetical protein [Thermoleophilaceae bacterium]